MEPHAFEPVEWPQPSTSGVEERPVDSADIDELDNLEGVYEVDDEALRPIIFRSKRRLRLPKEGITSSDGYLFHHAGPLNITQKHRDRLLEYGIKLKCMEGYTPREDKRIRRNWEKFAEKHGLKYEDARYYAGYMDGSDLGSMVDRESEMKRVEQLGLWPHLCRKLERRSAKQVRMRVIHLFDPHYIGLSDPITSAEALRGYEILSKGGTISDAAMMLKRPVVTLSCAIHRKTRQLLRMGYTMDEALQDPDLLQERVMHPLRYRSFFNDVLKVIEVEERFVAEEMCNSRSIEFLEKLTHGFNWEILTSKFPPFNRKNLKDSWSHIISNLLKVYLGIVDTDSDADDVTAWDMAVEEALPVIDVSMSVVLPYLKSLRKSYSEKAMFSRSSCVNQYKMAKMLYKEGIIGQTLSYDLNSCPLYIKLRHILNRQDRFLLRHLELSITMKEKLTIVEMCYKSIMKSPNYDPSLKMTHLPRITTICYVENFVRFMSKTLPDWEAPQVLQIYIRDPELFHLFSKTSKNNGIVNVQNIIQMRKQFFGNSTCLKTIPMSGAEVALLKYIRPGYKRIYEPTPEAVDEADEAIATPSERKRKHRGSAATVSTGWGARPIPEDDINDVDNTDMFETPMVPVKRQKKMKPLVFSNDSTMHEANQDDPLLEENQTHEAHAGDGTFDEYRLANETVLAGCQSIMKKGSKKSRRSVRFREDTVLPAASPEKDSDRASEELEENDSKVDTFKHLRVEKSPKDVKTVLEAALPAAFSQDDFMNLFS